MQIDTSPAQAKIDALRVQFAELNVQAAASVTVVDIARDMIAARTLADELHKLGLDQAAQYSYDDAAMDAAEIRRRLANL